MQTAVALNIDIALCRRTCLKIDEMLAKNVSRRCRPVQTFPAALLRPQNPLAAVPVFAGKREQTAYRRFSYLCRLPTHLSDGIRHNAVRTDAFWCEIRQTGESDTACRTVLFHHKASGNGVLHIYPSLLQHFIQRTECILMKALSRQINRIPVRIVHDSAIIFRHGCIPPIHAAFISLTQQPSSTARTEHHSVPHHHINSPIPVCRRRLPFRRFSRCTLQSAAEPLLLTAEHSKVFHFSFRRNCILHGYRVGNAA